ncbi:MAG: helix-turn-helix transcriptional regulator [Chloroflexia bacterium]
MAERARLSVRAISDLERGARRTPRPETIALLADALGLSATDRATLIALSCGGGSRHRFRLPPRARRS